MSSRAVFRALRSLAAFGFRAPDGRTAALEVSPDLQDGQWQVTFGGQDDRYSCHSNDPLRAIGATLERILEAAKQRPCGFDAPQLDEARAALAALDAAIATEGVPS